MDIILALTEELKVEKWQVEAAVKLIDEGNTIPFISRYRKEATGALNDEVLRNLYERLNYLRNLEDKKNQVLASHCGAGQTDRGAEDAVSWQPRPWWSWRTCTARIVRSAAQEPPLPRKKAWNPWQIYSAADDRQVPGRGSNGLLYPRKRASKPRKMPSRGQRTSWQSASPTRRTTELLSGMQP